MGKRGEGQESGCRRFDVGVDAPGRPPRGREAGGPRTRLRLRDRAEGRYGGVRCHGRTPLGEVAAAGGMGLNEAPMTEWTNEELTKIEAADELEIASLRRAGTRRSPPTVWVVRVGDDLYVR